MLANFRYSLLLFSILIFIPSLKIRSQELTAIEIVRKSDEKGRGISSQGNLTMTIIRPEWSRSISLKTWSKGNAFSLILITGPAKEKGQVFLKRKSDMWNWVPSIEKMIKIPPSMMMQSWMGSDFTNDDLVRESSIIADYTHTLLGIETVRDQECYKIQLDPLPDAPVTWGRVILWITKNGFNQWKADYYDEDMTLVSAMNAYDIRMLHDRELPTRMEIEPINKKGQKTILEIKSMQFNTPIDDNFFSQQNMKKIR